MATQPPLPDGHAESGPRNHHSSDLTQPATAHVRESYETWRRPSASTATAPDGDRSSDDEREATELRDPEQRRLSRVLSPAKPSTQWYAPAAKFWRHEIRISVPHVDCRDHLANERTFLAYLRTSVILSIIGVFVAQLYRLQPSPNPSATFGYYVMSTPLSLTFQAAALFTVLVGGYRFWRQQSAMARGLVWAGGWELVGLGVGGVVLLTMLFGVHVALDVVREGRPWPAGYHDFV